MKSRRRFTSAEIATIRRHLRELVRADGPTQKKIRDQIRELDFYIDEFKAGSGRFEVRDFDYLLEIGSIAEDNLGSNANVFAPEIVSGPDAADAVRALRAQAAEKYRPKKVRVLLVAEAPPSAPDRYFYFDDVKSHDWLFRGICEALLLPMPDRFAKGSALAQLRDQGCFLIDLKPTPVDGTSLAMYVPDLVVRCKDLDPGKIILIKATVYDAAYQALRSAGLPVVNRRVYFPSTGRQRDFLVQFAEALNADV